MKPDILKKNLDPGDYQEHRKEKIHTGPIDKPHFYTEEDEKFWELAKDAPEQEDFSKSMKEAKSARYIRRNR